MHYVLAFRIKDARRRERARTLLRSYGWEVMPGLFECPLEPAQADEMHRRLEQILAPDDQTRLYQVCEGCLKQSRQTGGPEWTQKSDAWIF